MEQQENVNKDCLGKDYNPDEQRCSGCKALNDCAALHWLRDLGFGKSPNLIPVFQDAFQEAVHEFPEDQKKQDRAIIKAVNKWIEDQRARLHAQANELPRKVKMGSRDWPLVWHRNNPRIENMMYRTHLHDVVNYTKRHFTTFSKSDKLAEALRLARKKLGHKKGCGFYCHYDEEKGELVKHRLVYFQPDYHLAEFGTFPPPPPGSKLPYRKPMEITTRVKGRVAVDKRGMKKSSLQKTMRQAAKAHIFPCFGKVEENGRTIYAYGYETESYVKGSDGDWVRQRTRHLFVKQDSHWEEVLIAFKCGENGQSRN